MPLEDTLTIVMRERTTPIVRFVNGPTQPSCTEMIVPVKLSHRVKLTEEELHVKHYIRYYKFWFVGELLPPRDKKLLYIYNNITGTVDRSEPFSANVQRIFEFCGWTAKLVMNQEVSEEEYDAEIYKWAPEGLRREMDLKKEMEKVCQSYVNCYSNRRK